MEKLSICEKEKQELEKLVKRQRKEHENSEAALRHSLEWVKFENYALRDELERLKKELGLYRSRLQENVMKL